VPARSAIGRETGHGSGTGRFRAGDLCLPRPPRRRCAAGPDGRTEQAVVNTKDSNGATLSDGDSVQVIKDLKVKGASSVLKRGTVIRNIRVTSEDGEVEGNSDKIKGLVLKACFLKKV
jgi:protein PhnA